MQSRAPSQDRVGGKLSREIQGCVREFSKEGTGAAEGDGIRSVTIKGADCLHRKLLGKLSKGTRQKFLDNLFAILLSKVYVLPPLIASYHGRQIILKYFFK